ncbi:MAG: L-aspartate oxidase [Acidimicrobiales bacterium]
MLDRPEVPSASVASLGEVDVLVVGSGVAGLTLALNLAGRLRVAVISKQANGGGSTQLAQGGIAAALGPDDSWELHAEDTVAAAAGLGDPEVAEVVTREAAEAVAALSRFGVTFDRGALGREGGHSRARVAHARGDATGAEISRALVEAARQSGVPLVSNAFLVDLVTAPSEEAVVGALVRDGAKPRLVTAKTVVLATGGYGQLWARTTSPLACSGDGLAAAFRAGAQLADLEFVQFHPTGLDLGADPRPLATEALRGAGARLRGADGEYLHEDPALDLAPRDVVSRSMAKRMAELRASHCYLDATAIGATTLAEKFPTFVASCRSAGIDPARQWAPVAPTAHYTIGGVLTDLDGRSTLPGLMAVGEVASSGLHGANRLASNSLLEGCVIGHRAAGVLLDGGGLASPRGQVPLDVTLPWPKACSHGGEGTFGRAALREAMQAGAGVMRQGAHLQELAERLAHWPVQAGSQEGWELANMVLVGRLVVALASRRCESRGAHWRLDYPTSHPDWRVRQVIERLGEEELGVANMAVTAPDQATSEEPSSLSTRRPLV